MRFSIWREKRRHGRIQFKLSVLFGLVKLLNCKRFTRPTFFWQIILFREECLKKISPFEFTVSVRYVFLLSFSWRNTSQYLKKRSLPWTINFLLRMDAWSIWTWGVVGLGRTGLTVSLVGHSITKKTTTQVRNWKTKAVVILVKGGRSMDSFKSADPYPGIVVRRIGFT